MFQSAPERSNKDGTKYSTVAGQQLNSVNNTHLKMNGQATVVKDNLSGELPKDLSTTNNGHAHHTTVVEQVKQERGRSRDRKDDRKNSEFFSQITATVQNLQRDLDRITARVRSLEGHALNALSPEPVSPQGTSKRYTQRFSYLSMTLRRKEK